MKQKGKEEDGIALIPKLNSKERKLQINVPDVIDAKILNKFLQTEFLRTEEEDHIP